jgi:hypothetical protein
MVLSGCAGGGGGARRRAAAATRQITRSPLQSRNFFQLLHDWPPCIRRRAGRPPSLPSLPESRAPATLPLRPRVDPAPVTAHRASSTGPISIGRASCAVAPRAGGSAHLLSGRASEAAPGPSSEVGEPAAGQRLSMITPSCAGRLDGGDYTRASARDSVRRVSGPGLRSHLVPP